MKRRNKLLLYSPAFHPLTSLRRNGDFPKYQYPDYQKINPLDTIKQGAWVSAAFTPEFSQVCAITPRKAYISCQSASHAARTLPCHRWHYS